MQSVAGGAEHNFAPMREAWFDPSVLPAEAHGLSAFARGDGTVYHTYSAYARGGDATWAMWRWLDRAPLGRNEGICRGSTATTNIRRDPILHSSQRIQ